MTTPDRSGHETLNESELVVRTLAVVAAVAEERTDDVDELLRTLDWPGVTTVAYSLANVAVESLAVLYGLDSETPEGRAAVADQARRLVMREMTDDDDG
ncbi:hypothetical protein [Streptomyces viridosporus]|uniref:hypothetical protein n=1 Tax=Streptomyces viridosporus TaxID=67581 RepID=UPI0036FFE084